MKIRAKISFSNAYLMDAIKRNNFKIKDIATLLNFKHHNKLSHILHFKVLPTEEEKLKIYKILHTREPSIKYSKLFPHDLKKYHKIFGINKNITKEIPADYLLQYEEERRFLPSLEKEYSQKEEVSKMLHLDNLTDQEKKAVMLYYGFDGVEDRTLKAAGKEMNVCAERVKQLIHNSFKKIRKKFKIDGNYNQDVINMKKLATRKYQKKSDVSKNMNEFFNNELKRLKEKYN
jgi:predicted RNA-binding protein